MLATMPMHPICAWGVITDLASYYNTGRRQSAAYAGGDAVSGILQVAAGSAGQTWRTLTSMVGARLGKEKKDVRSAVAESINWAKLLSTDCKNARSRQQVMAPACIGKVCWNMVQDFRDLWCSWWKTDAASHGCSFSNGECCSAIRSEHMRYIKAEFDATNKPKVLADMRVERFKRLSTAFATRFHRRSMDKDTQALVQRERKELHAMITERVNAYYAILQSDDLDGMLLPNVSLDTEGRREEIERARAKEMERLQVSQEEMRIAASNVADLAVTVQVS